jgi:4-oxalocrotonate tautomerase
MLCDGLPTTKRYGPPDCQATERKMPEVYVHAIEGRTKDQKRALIKDITAAVVKNFEVAADAVLVEIIETSRENKAKGGVLFSER